MKESKKKTDCKIYFVEKIDNQLYDISNFSSIFWSGNQENYEEFIESYNLHNTNFLEIDKNNGEPQRYFYSQNIPFMFFHCSPPSSVRLFWDDDMISRKKALKKRITRGGKN